MKPGSVFLLPNKPVLTGVALVRKRARGEWECKYVAPYGRAGEMVTLTERFLSHWCMLKAPAQDARGCA